MAACTNDPQGAVARSFAGQLAVELDRPLRGSGTAPEPRGILNQTGVTLTSHGANGSLRWSRASLAAWGLAKHARPVQLYLLPLYDALA